MMMKIMVPTDFSPTANYAFEAACRLAKYTAVELHLYHATNVGIDWRILPTHEALYSDLNQRLTTAAEAMLKSLQAEANAKGIDCKTHISDGHFIDHLQTLVDRISIDLIVMGSHGISGKSEWFIGSNTQKALRKLDTNVLVVKDQINNYDFSKVLFATNLMVEDRLAFRSFLDFIKIFPVKEIHILTIKTQSFFSTPTIIDNAALKDFEDIADNYHCYTHRIEDFSVDNGIRKFADSHNIDLIGISNHQQHPLQHFLRGSNVEIMINHTHLPVLSIDYAKHDKPASES